MLPRTSFIFVIFFLVKYIVVHAVSVLVLASALEERPTEEGNHGTTIRSEAMLINRCANLSFIFTVTVAVTLHVPQNLTMEAVNTQYILKWDWDQTQRNYTMKFTAEYTFSNNKQKTESYKRACNITAERQCDFSFQNLSYLACYTLRVRAEGQREHSHWSQLDFCPDEQALLGPPSHVEVTSREAMLVVRISEPLTAYNTSMSSIMQLFFKVQYWERNALQQRSSQELNKTWGSLYPLKPWTEYCLKVCAFNKDYEKTSLFTEEQCVWTSGKSSHLFWKTLPGVLCCLLLMMWLIYRCYLRIKSLCLLPVLPSYIQDGPTVFINLLELQEETCVDLCVVDIQTLPFQPEDRHQELTQAQRQDSSGQDSGICSGGECEESSQEQLS